MLWISSLALPRFSCGTSRSTPETSGSGSRLMYRARMRTATIAPPVSLAMSVASEGTMPASCENTPCIRSTSCERSGMKATFWFSGFGITLFAEHTKFNGESATKPSLAMLFLCDSTCFVARREDT